ncbi:DUF3558 domain-containing protein [Saccharomonospora sp. CUA-673]|uniref:DUF3558 domain-containing protein n=1 Tax=Saccharomonospora sp. CUA-673 TaxID=1904969 RepID=UPI0009FA2791|nr:DUF3558 domain-containing protein [Saccharomonospora sp. CUA-673]
MLAGATEGEDLPHSGAPAVTNPLPESVLSGDPCVEAVTEEQAKELLGEGVQHEPQQAPELGPSCRWSNLDTGAAFRLSYDVNTREGLSGGYRNVEPQMPIFNEIEPVDGFPAVEYKKSEDDLTCTTVVGLADEYGLLLTLTVGQSGREKGNDPCDGGRIVMEQIVSNLKAKA